MANYTVQQINSMNSSDLKQAAISLGVDFNGLSDVLLRAQLDAKIQSSLNGKNNVSAPTNLINGKDPKEIAALQKKYDASTVAMNQTKEVKNQYSNVFEQAKAQYGQSDPSNSTLKAAKNNYEQSNQQYVEADNMNTFLNSQLFSALT